ncbi:TPA: hypothetical protein ACPT5B_005156, partial [Escherichia coli]
NDFNSFDLDMGPPDVKSLYRSDFQFFFTNGIFFCEFFREFCMANLRMEEALRVSDIRCKRERPKGPHFIVEEK